MASPDTITVTRKPDQAQDPVHTSLDWKLLRRMLSYMRPYAHKRNRLILIVLLRAVQLPVLAWIFGTYMKRLLVDPPVSEVVEGALVFAVFALFTAVVMHFRVRWSHELGDDVVRDMRAMAFAHMQKQTMGFFDRTKVGRIISRVISDTEAIKFGVQNVLFSTLVGLGQMLVAAAMMLWISPPLFLIVLAITPVLWALNQFFHLRLTTAHRAMRESFSRLTATLAESVSGIRVTQGFVREDVNADLFHKLVSDHASYNLRTQLLQGVFVPLLELNSQVFIAALLLVGAWMTLGPTAETQTVGDLVQFFFLANVFFAPVSSLGLVYAQALAAMAGAERVFHVLDQEPAWQDEPDAPPLPPIKGRVEFERVSFSYEPGRPVLHEISFKAKPGQTIAFVGQTGSGKSSIINLLAKFYLPDSGRVLIDGHDTRYVQSDSLHTQMGIVLQANFLFTGSVMDNIRMARPAASDEEVVAAAERLDCRDLLEMLPDGFHTVVGEGGSGISSGQRQLICFCRAMLADPRILILDEATSAVDTMTEARIQRALQLLLAERTSFVVAHRLSTIRHAQEVLVLDDGRIAERGKHTELLSEGGIYAHLYRQFIHASEA